MPERELTGSAAQTADGAGWHAPGGGAGAEPRTNPIGFRNPHSRRNRMGRMFWALTYALLFRPTPWFMARWRAWLLRRFGAKIGIGRIESSARIWAPWLLELGDYVYIDARVNLYNPFGIRIGDRVIVSQGTFLCTATHDYRHPHYPLTGGRITIAEDCWVAAEAFVGPGVTLGAGSVVGARSVVTKDVPPWTVVAGHPARPIKERTLDAAAAENSAEAAQSAAAAPGGPAKA
jgi:putative colanic acid biosynthesis acetyltransferase WcaF